MALSLKKELLRIIDSGESFETLIQEQISYTQIALALLEYEQKGFIKNYKTGYKLTKIGQSELEKSNAFEEILPLEEYKLENKIGLDKIYIPDYIEEVIEELKN